MKNKYDPVLFKKVLFEKLKLERDKKRLKRIELGTCGDSERSLSLEEKRKKMQEILQKKLSELY